MLETLLSEVRFPTWICIISGLAYLGYVRKLDPLQLGVLILIWINISADVLSNYLVQKGVYTNGLYKVSTLLEQGFTLFIYMMFCETRTAKWVHAGLLTLIVSLFIVGLYAVPFNEVFTFETFITGGLIIAATSYFAIRRWVVHAKPMHSFLWFAFANMFYYTLMVSSASAQPIAWQVSKEFAARIKYINDAGYIAWSLILLTGLIWSIRKTTSRS